MDGITGRNIGDRRGWHSRLWWQPQEPITNTEIEASICAMAGAEWMDYSICRTMHFIGTNLPLRLEPSSISFSCPAISITVSWSSGYDFPLTNAISRCSGKVLGSIPRETILFLCTLLCNCALFLEGPDNRPHPVNFEPLPHPQPKRRLRLLTP